MTNEIIISRNDQGHYVINDYMGTTVYERVENALAHIRMRLETQDARIAEYRLNPEAWLVNGISELTC